MPTCKELLGSASDHLDGNTSVLQNLNFRFHLVMCKHCRCYVEQLKLTMKIVNRSGEMPTSTEDEIDKVVTKMKEQGEGEGKNDKGN